MKIGDIMFASRTMDHWCERKRRKNVSCITARGIRTLRSVKYHVFGESWSSFRHDTYLFSLQRTETNYRDVLINKDNYYYKFYDINFIFYKNLARNRWNDIYFHNLFSRHNKIVERSTNLSTVHTLLVLNRHKQPSYLFR